MSDRLYTSKSAEDILNELRYNSKVEFYILARIAFFLSLEKDGKDVKKSADFRGKEINRPTFVGTDEIFLKALISYVYNKSDINEEEFYSNKSIIKNHIDNGCEILNQIYKESESDINSFLLRLAKQAKGNFSPNIVSRNLDLFIGIQELSNKKVILELNNTNKHPNSHMAIMGKPGVGKTQFLLKILTDIRIQSNYQTNFIFFDYKGDVIENKSFIEKTKSDTFSLPSESLPVNPFILPDYGEKTILLSAREKADSFSSINNKLGPVQTGSLTEAIREAYSLRQNLSIKYPDFNQVFQIIKQKYEDENKKDDTLIQILKDLSDFKLFWEHGSEQHPIEKLSEKTMLVDLHELPVLKELVAYLVIERLYKEMAMLPDSNVKNGKREIRLILVIDEAHNYLPQKNTFLQKIIREGRSKGIFVFFASQSPNDYSQKEFDFRELLQFVFIFQCEGVSASAVESILGCTNKVAKKLQSDISKLLPFHAISKDFNNSKEYIQFEAEAFYKHYNK